MSILAEIAEKADVPVEGVIRVLTREPVSEAVQERVLAVLGDLDAEQTRAVQRYALAALHDVLERPAERAGQAAAALQPGSAVSEPTGAPDAALAELGSVLGELAEAIRDLRRETDTERRERVDDLAVLIELITTGWQGLDARLGRIERQVGRLEAARREPALLPAPPPPRTALAAPAPVTPRRRRSLAAGLTLAVGTLVTLAVLQLAAGGPDVSRLVASRTDAASTTAPTTTQAKSPRPSAATPPARGTTSAAGTTEQDPVATTAPPRAATRPATTAPAAKVAPPATTAPPAKTAPPATTASSATTAPPKTTTGARTTPRTSAGFRPTRNWAWAPVPAADYYSVEFSRDGKSIYRTTTTLPLLTLPESIVFRPGSYRWVVLPGFGPRSESRYGAPVVDSGFTVSS